MVRGARRQYTHHGAARPAPPAGDWFHVSAALPGPAGRPHTVHRPAPGPRAAVPGHTSGWDRHIRDRSRWLDYSHANEIRPSLPQLSRALHPVHRSRRGALHPPHLGTEEFGPGALLGKSRNDVDNVGITTPRHLLPEWQAASPSVTTSGGAISTAWGLLTGSHRRSTGLDGDRKHG